MCPLKLEDPELGFQHLLALLHRADVEVEVVVVHVNWKRRFFRNTDRPLGPAPARRGDSPGLGPAARAHLGPRSCAPRLPAAAPGRG